MAEQEELSDEALETMLILVGCYIERIKDGAGGSGWLWYATQNTATGSRFYFSEDTCRSDANKRALMLRCRSALLDGVQRLDISRWLK